MSGGRMSFRDRALAIFLPAVLALFAGIAIVRFHRVDQSTWQGVGFGMFASYEYGPARTLRASATTDGETTAVTVPAAFRDEVIRVLVAPGDPEAERLAERLHERVGAESVEIEIWGHDVDRFDGGMGIGFKLIRRVQFP